MSPCCIQFLEWLLRLLGGAKDDQKEVKNEQKQTKTYKESKNYTVNFNVFAYRPSGPGEKKRRKKSLSESGSLSTSEPTSESKPETLEVPQDNDGDEQQHVLVYEAKAPTKLQGRRVNLPVAGRNKCNLSNCAVCLGSCSKLQAKARHYTPCPDDLTAVPCCYQGQNHSVSSEDASEGKGFVGKLLRKGKHALGRESKEGEDGRLKGAVKATKAKMNDCLLGCRQKLECEGIPIDETLKQGDFDLLSTNGSMYKPEEAGSVSCPNIFPSCPVKCDKSDKPKDEPTDDATTQASEPEKKEGFFPRMWGNLKNRSAALFKRAGEKLDKPDDQEVASEETEEAKPTKPKSRWWWPLSKDETEAEEGEEPRSGKKKPAPFVIKVSVGFNINEMCCALVTCAAAINGLLYYFKAF